MSNVEQSIQTLRDEIRHHDALYYAQAAPEISDRQYDRLMQQLQQLEGANPELITPDSPTHRVGGAPTKGFRKVRHREPMLSIDNTYCREDIVRFDKRVRDALGDRTYSYGVEPKIDGVAVALRYHGRMLVEALTRGDGATGDDITGNARTIRSIPLNLGRSDMPDELEIRGEIHWARSAFNRYNAQRLAEGQEPLANSRNGTAGTIKQQNPHIVAQRQLSFTAHGFGHMSHPLGSTGEEVTERLRVCGVPISAHRWVCHSVDDIWEAIEAWDALRSDADYDTDGLVIKVNELEHRQTLGETPRHPRWCIAYKFEADRAATVLRDVSFQIGRTGVLTPVAHFDPVSLGGTTVSNASLHNFDNVARLRYGATDIRIGDTVIVEKAGEIIPQVISVDLTKRPRTAKPITPPSECLCDRHAPLSFRPVPEGMVGYRCTSPECEDRYRRKTAKNIPDSCIRCSQPVEPISHMVDLRCTQDDCPHRLREGVAYFAGRDQMDIENLGPEVVGQLVETGLVSHVADLFSLTAAPLERLEGFAETSAKKLVDGIDESRTRGLSRVIASLGIPNVGRRAAGVMARAYGSADALQQATVEQLQSLEEIGPTIAANVYGYLHSDEGVETMRRLAAGGVVLTEASASGPQSLAGLSVVVTGTLETMTRQEAKAAIEAAGGKPASTVSKQTAFVLAGKNAGSKLATAESLEVDVIDETEFRRRLEVPASPPSDEPDSDSKFTQMSLF